MEPTEIKDTAMPQEHISHIRLLRHQAIRRRRIISLSLAALALLVLFLALVLKFSPLFALIPCVLLLVVLALGARASQHARAWEHKVAASGAGQRASTRSKAHSHKSVNMVEEKSDNRVPSQGLEVRQDHGFDARQYPVDAVTDVMEQREIRRALKDTRQAKKAMLEEHSKRSQATFAEQSDVQASRGQKVLPPVQGAIQAGSTNNVRLDPLRSENTLSKDGNENKLAHAQSSSDSPSMNDNGVFSDSTTQLKKVHPAPALDAFDMASGQDLISFSLGKSRIDDDVDTEEPRSLEIKSARQVVRANPADTDNSQSNGKDRQSNDKDGHNISAFHDAEIEADVSAPEATSDSLSVGLEAIFARRSS